MDMPHSDVPFEARLTRPYLASLSTEELVRLADRLGMDIPYGLDRVFIIEELLELAADDEFELEVDENEEGAVHQVFREMTVLPRQYNISYIEVMIRDPLWAFVFWEIKSHLKEIYEKSADFEGYFLRVIPLNENGMPLGKDDLFTVSVGIDDNAWYLGFPPAEVLPAPARDALSAFERTRRGPAAETPATGKIGRYRVELCAQQDEKLILLTVSRPFKMPRLIESKLNEPLCMDLPGEPDAPGGDIQAVYRNPMAVLSGVNDFTLIRSVNRQSRVRGV
jgi:hypothetical protein